MKIRPSNFQQESREFLNETNKIIPEEKRKIRSFKISKMIINKTQILNFSPTWCDLTCLDLTIWYLPFTSEISFERKDKAPRKHKVVEVVSPSFFSIPLDSIDSFNLTPNSSLFVINKGKKLFFLF
jgi:hypothetical protein